MDTDSTKIITDILKRYNLYNETHKLENGNMIISYGSSPKLQGTIKFICTRDGVYISCKILTSESMYLECEKLYNRFKDSKINLFQPTPLFFSSYGSNGLINTKILIDSSTLDVVDSLMLMNEVTTK